MRRRNNWLLLAAVAVATYIFKDKITPFVEQIKSKIQ